MYLFTEEKTVPAQGGMGHCCNEVCVSIAVLNHTWIVSNNYSVIFHLAFVY